jgi:hypothetical protein
MSDIKTKMADGIPIKIGTGPAGGASKRGTQPRVSAGFPGNMRQDALSIASAPNLRPGCGLGEDEEDGRTVEGDAQVASPMSIRPGDLRRLSDEMLIFWLQKLAPEKYGKAAPFGKDGETGRRGEDGRE